MHALLNPGHEEKADSLDTDWCLGVFITTQLARVLGT